MPEELSDPRNCGCFNLRRATRQVTQNFDRALAGAGLTAGQFSLLAQLSSETDGKGLPISTLAERLGMDRTTLTRALKPVERAGLVDVRPGEDLRQRNVRLSPAGRQRLDQAFPLWRQAQDRLVERLGAEGFDNLLAITRSLRG